MMHYVIIEKRFSTERKGYLSEKIAQYHFNRAIKDCGTDSAVQIVAISSGTFTRYWENPQYAA